MAGSGRRSRVRDRSKSVSSSHGAIPRRYDDRYRHGPASRGGSVGVANRARQSRRLGARAGECAVSRSRGVSSNALPGRLMKILLASADLDDIAWAARNGFLDGVMTTPALLREHEGDEREQLAEICRVVDAPVYVTVHAVDGEDVYRDGKDLARLSDQIVIQVPLVEDAIGAVRRLANDGVRVASLLVFNAAQALLAAKAGASSVVTSIDHLDQVGHSGINIVRELREAFDAS